MNCGAAVKGSWGRGTSGGTHQQWRRERYRSQVPKPWVSFALSLFPSTDQLPNAGAMHPLALPGSHLSAHCHPQHTALKLLRKSPPNGAFSSLFVFQVSREPGLRPPSLKPSPPWAARHYVLPLLPPTSQSHHHPTSCTPGHTPS